MIDRLKNRATLFALLAAGLTALGVGGVAIAQSGGDTPAKATQSAKEREADAPGDKGDANEKGEKGDDAKEKGDRGDGANEKGDAHDGGSDAADDD
jgi:hypothetical protein